MRSSLVVRASDCQCTSPGLDPSIRRYTGIWWAADEAVMNIVRKINKNPPKKIIFKNSLKTKFWILLQGTCFVPSPVLESLPRGTYETSVILVKNSCCLFCFTTLPDLVLLRLYPTAFPGSDCSQRTPPPAAVTVTSRQPRVTSLPAKLMFRPPEVTSPSQPLVNVTSPRPREVTSPPPRRRHWLSARPMRSGGARAGPRSHGGSARYSSISCSRKYSAQVIHFIIGTCFKFKFSSLIRKSPNF